LVEGEAPGLALPSHPSTDDQQGKSSALNDEEPRCQYEERDRVSVLQQEVETVDDPAHQGIEAE